ncbi:TetR/AcrR family transcriptional regulator [Streptomyces sp. NPDC058665]|uniref:TetR/AcrR family transcriptional regulator n=1 Tax=Streptomyces sp. NPDC058665 TaxID=3346586 RepID=UPI003653592C
MSQTLRADALDNRERILGAARELLSAEGLNVPTRKIARSAGVGPATVYRRFPTRQDLIAAAFADQLRACRTIVDEGAAAPDPWEGLCLVIEKICELHARDRGFTEAFLSAFPAAIDVAGGREYTVRAVAELARRAKATGRLRADFVLDDLILMLMANKGIHASTNEAQVAASRRFAAYVIEAFEARPRQAPLPPAPRDSSARGRP